MNDNNDNNDTLIRFDRPAPVSKSEARKSAAAHRRAAGAARSRTIYTPHSPRSRGNVVCIREWLLRVADERHAHANDPVAKAKIERWMVQLSKRGPGDYFPS